MVSKNIILDTEQMMATFGLKRNHGCALLERLLDVSFEEQQPILQAMEPHRMRLVEEGDFWNEEELKMQFLAFLFFHVGINEVDKIKIFYERPLKAKVEGNSISVICDCMLAKPLGINRPDKPYFFLQEFKKQKKADDAEGQMLGAMLIAQTLNANDKPVYGAFLQGRNWIFTTLHGKDYCISEQLDATKTTEFAKIIGVLKNIKQSILESLK
ncbi:MAG: hypothetical protein RLZZ292_2094 [Bacteroidota bacterium]|jgi:hypothetical protein